ncbi:hypothetical protein A0H81_08831 [Grifola frondosa]|uniref:F-box domain-containing protein n=1 Tax=Grifola frondosa TaxID=5627 RepID=A0A1C7M5J5_GRIFR|nr:hypothetical protein A0H81_08831 [Grifola frondosa]
MIKITPHEPDSLLIEGPSSTVDLDFDVIYTILSFLLNRTCTRRMESFCAFMVAQAPLRYPFLQFHISWNADPVFWAKDPLYEMVKQMKSPLVEAHLNSATSEDLEVYYSTFQSELHFPRMRKLSAYEWDYPPPGLIAQIFPNLIDLTVSNDYRGDDLSTADDQYRQQSLSVQLAGGGWTSLDQLAGRPADLYKLGLTCQIRRVKIFYVTSRSRGMVAHILSDCRPSHVHILLNQIFSCVLCLPDEVAVRLTYLRCTIDLAHFSGDSSALDTFRLLLQRSPLTHFMLRFMANRSRITEGVRLVREFRSEAFASQIIASHPSIRYIVIKISYAKPLFWKVLTTESGEVVVDKAPKEDISVVMDL